MVEILASRGLSQQVDYPQPLDCVTCRSWNSPGASERAAVAYGFQPYSATPLGIRFENSKQRVKVSRCRISFLRIPRLTESIRDSLS